MKSEFHGLAHAPGVGVVECDAEDPAEALSSSPDAAGADTGGLAGEAEAGVAAAADGPGQERFEAHTGRRDIGDAGDSAADVGDGVARRPALLDAAFACGRRVVGGLRHMVVRDA